MISLQYSLRDRAAHVSDGAVSADLFPTHIFGDPLAGLTDTVIALLQERYTLEPVVHVVCEWQDEPGEYRWLFEREGADLRIRILRFADTFSKLADEQGELLFATECPMLKFAILVKTQLSDALKEFDLDEYERLAKYPFPARQYETLRQLIRQEQLKAKE